MQRNKFTNSVSKSRVESGGPRCKESQKGDKFHLEPLHYSDGDLNSPGLPKLTTQSSQSQRLTTTVDGSHKESWEPFSCMCHFCGLKFGKHSILIHEKRCSNKHRMPPLAVNESTATSSESVEVPVARIVTVGLGPIQCEQLTVRARLPPRPETRTLRHSSLRESGFGLPYVQSTSNSHFSNTNSISARIRNSVPSECGHKVILCDNCGRVVTADRASVHNRLCKPDILQRLSKTSVSFPSSSKNLLKVEQGYSRQPKVIGKKPPTVVCYICGREYGTKSIAIHEPQCLKKFEAENRKLPINKRKPLPRKRSTERAKVVQFVAKEEEILAVSSRPTELTDEKMELVFQQCYADFENELVPCKTCGRKFAPERHKQHEPKCNAKPLRYHKL